MKPRNAIILLAVIVLVVVGFLLLKRSQPSPAELPAGATTSNEVKSVAKSMPEGTTHAEAAVPAGSTNKTYRVHAGQVLATVNGTKLTLKDLIPLSGTNADAEQTISDETYQYFMDRAINRELVMQTAQARGLSLNESQRQQLEKMQSLRDQSEPGLLQKFTVDSAQIEFELRDAEAFMLQTLIMAQAGASPDVTPEQVQNYYHTHVSQFGDLPSDPDVLKDWWQKNDPIIRELMAKDARMNYYERLKVFMDDLKGKAQINITSLPAS